jgi:hypothetical protein
MAFVLNVIGDITRSNLNTIKHVRNTLAHSGLEIGFHTREIIDACDSLVLPSGPESFREVVNFNGAYGKYISICEVTSYSLVLYESGITPVMVSQISAMNPNATIDVPPTPLP